MTYTNEDIMKFIAAAIAKYPTLGPYGFLVAGTAACSWNNNDSHENGDLNQVRRALAFLQQCKKTKIGTQSSYFLKHVAERFAGNYVSNGALLVAAHALEFTIVVIGNDDPNANIGIDTNELKKFIKEKNLNFIV